MKTTPREPAKRDDGLEWLRKIRLEMAAECNFDPFEMGRRSRERQRAHPERIYRTKRVVVPVKQAAASSHSK